MPRRDAYHDSVKAALIKDGWRITHDPFPIGFRGTILFADLGAEKLVGTSRRRRKISIEVKVLSAPARFAKFECAVGQYVIYRRLMMSLKVRRRLYLAVPSPVFVTFFQNKAAVREVVAGEQIKLLIFDPLKQEIVRWTR
jgi:hypothetical protein